MKSEMTTIKTIVWGILILIIGSIFLSASEKIEKEGIVPLENFRKIVVLENGRKKPLDTFAQNLLKQFSGKSRLSGIPAIYWLARVLLDPWKSHPDKIFLVNNPEVLNAFGMSATGVRERYSFSQLKEFLPEIRKLAMSASRISREERSKIETELILLFNKLYVYEQLMAGFSFTRPNRDFSIMDPEIKTFLNLPQDRKIFSLFELLDKWQLIQEFKKKLQDREETSWTPFEKKLVKLAEKLESWTDLFYDLPLTIIPHLESGEEKWLAPIDSINQSFKSNLPIKKENYLVMDFVMAFAAGDQKKFDQSVKKFNQLVLDRFKGQLKEQSITLEIFYNQLDPFYKSQFFYGFTLAFLLLSLLMLKNWFYKIGVLLLCVGFVSHTLGIVFRMIIMERPPVTNLYETFVFTGWMTVLLGLILELFKKKNIGLLTGGFAGLIFLLIAGKYALEGDTMGMLMAVLDSNWWLAVHVITITVGFAGIVISGIIGHMYVLQNIFLPEKTKKKTILNTTFQALYATQAFGLIFTFAGTVLGGIWADQSWGRFWGWDPKENGALLVILWSVILFHARLAKMIGKPGFALGSIIGVITVALTWFGVNLLGVGLHSYGFTSGIAFTLLIVVSLEFLFVLITGFYIKKIKSP
jgi:ABC-type transport system involved in cytochrome c biogenesis permease subunit